MFLTERQTDRGCERIERQNQVPRDFIALDDQVFKSVRPLGFISEHVA